MTSIIKNRCLRDLVNILNIPENALKNGSNGKFHVYFYHTQINNLFEKVTCRGWRCRSAVEQALSMHKALGPIASTNNKNKILIKVMVNYVIECLLSEVLQILDYF